MPKYEIEVYLDGAKSRMFRYRVELHDTGKVSNLPVCEKPTRVAYDWCSYRFQIKGKVRKMVKEHLGTQNEELVTRFRLV